MKNRDIFFLFLILLLASFFRLWQLEAVPPGLYPDEAINGNEAIANPGKVFYPANNGREGLFINLIFLSFQVFGISIWSIKIVAATTGILTVLGLYLLTEELLKTMNPEPKQVRFGASNHQLSINNEIIALLSTFFLATSFWHINFSRIGFRAILLSFISVFAFYFLFKGFRLRRLSDFLIAGIFFGLGFYTYISYRFIVLLLFLVLISFWFVYQREKLQKKYLLFAISFFLLVFLIALPIGIYFLQNPQDLTSRAGPISIFAQENPVKAFFISFITHLGMFNFSGDFNWRHNFAGSPQLFLPIGIFFLIGIGYSIKKTMRHIMSRERFLFHVPCFLLAWFFLMLLPGVLTFEGIPHALRVIGVIPVVYILAGVGAWLMFEWAEKILKNRKLLLTFAFLLLVFVTGASFHKYFIQWAQNPAVKDAFSKNYVQIGHYLNSLPPEVKTYVIVNEPGVPLYGISIPAQTPMFVEAIKFGHPRSTYLKFEDLNQIREDHPKIAIVPLYDGRLFDELQKKFPRGERKTKDGFEVYEID